MYVVPPFLIVAVAALIGAVIMTVLFQRAALGRLSLGAGLGAVSGAVGALLAMLPLGFCPFVVEEEHTALNVVLGIAIILAVAAAVIAMVRWFAERLLQGRGIMPQSDTRQGVFNTSWLVPALLLLPTSIILLVFLYYPMFQTFRLSTQLARLGAPRTRFICLENFTRLATDPDYGYSVLVSFGIALAIVIVGLSLSLLIATMAYLPIKGARIYRTLLVWPYALSPVIAGIIFQLLFNPTAGVINHILDSLFGIEVPWLLDRNIAPITVIAASIWNISGFNILFYIAGLQNVPDDLIEAASIDGANAMQRFFRITFPLLSPITFFLIVTNTTYAFFDSFGLIDFMTAGGPNNATSTMMYEVYITGVVSRNLGQGAAQSLLLFLIVIAVTVIQFRASRDRVTYGA